MKTPIGRVVLPLGLGMACIALAAPTWRTAMAAAGYYNNSSVLFDCWAQQIDGTGIRVIVSDSSSGAPVIAQNASCVQTITDLLNDGFSLDFVHTWPHQKNQARARTRFLFIKP